MRSEKELQVLQSAINKAWNDPAFKAELISTPVEAIRKASGVNVSTSEGRELVVLDQTDSNFVYINIPPKPDTQGSYNPLISFPSDEI